MKDFVRKVEVERTYEGYIYISGHHVMVGDTNLSESMIDLLGWKIAFGVQPSTGLGGSPDGSMEDWAGNGYFLHGGVPVSDGLRGLNIGGKTLEEIFARHLDSRCWVRTWIMGPADG